MPNETPKLDSIANRYKLGSHIDNTDIIQALLEVRSILKVVRIGATSNAERKD